MGKAHSRSLSEGQAAELLDLTDYVQPTRPRRTTRRASGKDLVVTDDWPDLVPITERELRVIEAHFADFLDGVFGPRF